MSSVLAYLPQGNQPQLPDLPPPQCEKGGGGPGCGPPSPPPPTTCPDGGTPSRFNNSKEPGNVVNTGMVGYIGGTVFGVAVAVSLFGAPEAVPYEAHLYFGTTFGAAGFAAGTTAGYLGTSEQCPTNP